MSPGKKASSRKRRRVDPPPAPPQALIDLIKSNSEVKEFFTSLNAHIDAEVQDWKDRTEHYKKECQQLKNQLSQKRKSPQRGRRKETKLKESSPKDEIIVVEQEIDDAVFDAALSSDDEDDEVDSEAVAEIVTDQASWTIYELLRQAYVDLQQLGIALVVEEPEERQQDSAVTKEQNHSTPKLIRRSNEQVAADLMHAIHTLTRIPLSGAFSTDSFVPCCGLASHLAAKGKKFALQALSVMDVYCTSMTDQEWDSLFPPESEQREAVRLGMRDRRHLVDDLLSSLSGEITETWTDTSLRHSTLYYEATPDDKVASFAGDFDEKSNARLSALAERRFLAEIVSSALYKRDQCHEVLNLVCKYVFSTVPSLNIEDYPELQPALSLCVLEGLLCPNEESPSLLQMVPLGDNLSLLLRGMRLAIQATARVWELRLASSDERVSDISRVEIASYERLSKSNRTWLPDLCSRDEEGLDAYHTEATILLEDALPVAKSEGTIQRALREQQASFVVQIALFIIGDMRTLIDTFERAVRHCKAESSWIANACCIAYRHLQVRQLETFRLKQGSLVTVTSQTLLSDHLTSLLNEMLERCGPAPGIVRAVVECSIQLSDAEYLHRLVRWLPNQNIGPFKQGGHCTIISECLGSGLTALRAPTVRVINLKRRSDRLRTFMAQAQCQGILVAKAVARMDKNAAVPSTSHDVECDSIQFDTEYIWGLHAYNGQGRLADVESRLSEQVGDKLSTFIESYWRPNDLKAFDKDAREDDSLVRPSPSEVACALSHIASWKGVDRTIALCSHPRENVFGRFQLPVAISGYARGKAVLQTNENMAPTPVCVILEDDAILVDRFVDRLSLLLEELPRDFHFCSLGYGRPKTAPIAKYSSQLGIPSCIWYLTGYVLSLEGATYLLDSLPVRGPVDSWIGLKMCDNWDNMFGQAMGVGVRASSAFAELPSRKDLASILKFRAFVALVPLCSQKVDASRSSTAGRSWRQRDTDVAFSGNL